MFNSSIDNKEILTQEAPKKKLGPCCVCKETKKNRDMCIVEKSEENC